MLKATPALEAHLFSAIANDILRVIDPSTITARSLDKLGYGNCFGKLMSPEYATQQPANAAVEDRRKEE